MTSALMRPEQRVERHRLYAHSLRAGVLSAMAI